MEFKYKICISYGNDDDYSKVIRSEITNTFKIKNRKWIITIKKWVNNVEVILVENIKKS